MNVQMEKMKKIAALTIHAQKRHAKMVIVYYIDKGVMEDPIVMMAQMNKIVSLQIYFLQIIMSYVYRL